jgi:hypothetical protein
MELRTRKTIGFPMTLEEHPTDTFERFLAAFPEREDGHDREATLPAWRAAVARAPAERVIAGAVAYAADVEGRERRFVMSARRWLQEGRWRDLPRPAAHAAPALVWVAYGSPEWAQWAAFYRATKGKTPPLDRRGGWRFPTRTPPAAVAAE